MLLPNLQTQLNAYPSEYYTLKSVFSMYTFLKGKHISTLHTNSHVHTLVLALGSSHISTMPKRLQFTTYGYPCFPAHWKIRTLAVSLQETLWSQTNLEYLMSQRCKGKTVETRSDFLTAKLTRKSCPPTLGSIQNQKKQAWVFHSAY